MKPTASLPLIALAMLVICTRAHAQSGSEIVAACRAAYVNQLTTEYFSDKQFTYADKIYEQMCDRSTSEVKSGFDLNLGIPLDDLPVEVGINKQDKQSVAKSFCKTYTKTKDISSSSQTYLQSINVAALSSFNSCLALAASKVATTITFESPTHFTVEISPAQLDEISVINASISGNLQCDLRTSPSSAPIPLTAATTAKSGARIIVRCTRSSTPKTPSTAEFEQSFLTLNFAKEPSFSVKIPATILLYGKAAEQLEAALNQSRSELQSVTDQLKIAEARIAASKNIVARIASGSTCFITFTPSKQIVKQHVGTSIIAAATYSIWWEPQTATWKLRGPSNSNTGTFDFVGTDTTPLKQYPAGRYALRIQTKRFLYDPDGRTYAPDGQTFVGQLACPA